MFVQLYFFVLFLLFFLLKISIYGFWNGKFRSLSLYIFIVASCAGGGPFKDWKLALKRFLELNCSLTYFKKLVTKLFQSILLHNKSLESFASTVTFIYSLMSQNKIVVTVTVPILNDKQECKFLKIDPISFAFHGTTCQVDMKPTHAIITSSTFISLNISLKLDAQFSSPDSHCQWLCVTNLQ